MERRERKGGKGGVGWGGMGWAGVEKGKEGTMG